MKNKPIFDDIEFDSNEEIEFYQWILEAVEAGFISDFTYQPSSYHLSSRKSMEIIKQLKTKIKSVDKFLLHPHEYTADFIFSPTDTFPTNLGGLIRTTKHTKFVIDVKGTFQANGGDRSFSINQKWVYDKHGVYVNKVIPEKLFKSTWVPELARFTPKTKKLKAKYSKFKTIKQFTEDLYK